MEDLGGLGGLVIGILSLAVLVPLVGRAAASGSLGRVSGLGIKTKATTSSDLAWKTAHRAAVPWLLIGSRVGCGAAILAVIAAAVQVVAGVGTGVGMAVATAGGVTMLVLFMIGGRTANKAGAKVPRDLQERPDDQH